MSEAFWPILVYTHRGSLREVYEGDDRFGFGFPVARARTFFNEDHGPHNYVFLAYGTEGLSLALHFKATPE